MNLIIVGCEYTGKTTLGDNIVEWTDLNVGKGRGFHDHFTIPNLELGEEAADYLSNGPIQLKEMFQRFMIAHHLSRKFFEGPDQCMIGYHIEEAVYAPMYYGYGGIESGAPKRSLLGQRSKMAREVEKELLTVAKNPVLVLVTATEETIYQRMASDRHVRETIKKKDVPYLLERFHEEFENSLLPKKLILDTTNNTPKQTFDEFMTKYQPFVTEDDFAKDFHQKRLEQITLANNSYL